MPLVELTSHLSLFSFVRGANGWAHERVSSFLGDGVSLLRHDRRDGSGRRLAFGSSTGSLSLSENGGDGWTNLSAHLTPIHTMAFAR